MGEAMIQVKREIADERAWLWPCLMLTISLCVFVLACRMPWQGIAVTATILPLWIAAGNVFGAIIVFGKIIAARTMRPGRTAIRYAAAHPGRIIAFELGVILSGANLVAFMLVKPLLNIMVPFWAGPYLAQIDYWMFLGHDPWTLLTMLDRPWLATFYHEFWFGLKFFALALLLVERPGRDKAAYIAAYFVLWSVVGPVVHSLIPAAGPLFYSHLGYGNRFAGLAQVPETREAATYLWTLYSHNRFGPGAGISAMPSMHCAITMWTVLVFRRFAPALYIPSLIVAALIFLLSVALGWHYACDTIAGALLSWATVRAAQRYFAWREATEAPVRQLAGA